MDSWVYKWVGLSGEEPITRLKDHRSASMKLLSTITTVSFSVAIAAAAGVGAPIKARQDRSILMFTGTGFTGTAENFSGDVCVSASHLSSASGTDPQWFGSKIVPRGRAIRLEPSLCDSNTCLGLPPLHQRLVLELRCMRR